MDYVETMKGSLTLAVTESNCEDLQRGNLRLDNITYGTEFQNGSVKLVNKAAFFDSNSTKILTNLKFRKLGTDNADSVKVDLKTRGWVFICNSEIYIQDQLERVLVLGRNN